MALTPTELLGAAAFPLMLLAATAALASILSSRGSQMDPDDWMAVALVSTHRATAVASRVVAGSVSHKQPGCRLVRVCRTG